MKRFLYKAYCFFYAAANWRKRRFTHAGVLVLVILAVSAGLGMDTKQSTIYQVFTFVLPLLVVSMVCSYFFRARFSVTRKLPEFATVGETLTYSVEIRNQTAKKQKGLYFNENLEDSRPSFDEFIRAREPGEEKRNAWDRNVMYHRWMWLIYKNLKATVREHPIPALSPNGKGHASVDVVPLHRGYLELTGITVSRPDPLGLFKSFFTVSNHQRILVLPKRYSLSQLNLPGTRKHHPGGVALASSIGNSDEFVSLRDYRPGDPMRQIHWKSWAKAGKLIIKEFQDEFFVRHALILDTFQERPHSRIFEEAVSVAASFVSTIQTHESLLDLMFVGSRAYCFSLGRGLSHADKMMEILACVQPCHNKPFSDLLPMLINHAPLLSGCVCILLSWDEERKKMIKTLKSFNVPLVVIVVTDDAGPGSGPDPGYDKIQDAGPMKGDQRNFHILTADNMEEGLTGL